MTEPTIQEQIEASQRRATEGALAAALGDMSRAAAAVELAVLEAERTMERYDYLVSLIAT